MEHAHAFALTNQNNQARQNEARAKQYLARVIEQSLVGLAQLNQQPDDRERRPLRRRVQRRVTAVNVWQGEHQATGEQHK